MQSLALLLFGIQVTFAGTHSLLYFYIVVAGDINIQEFTVFGMVNDEQFMYFDCNTMKVVPKTEWIMADHWDRQTQIVNGHYLEYKNNMQMIKDVFNQSMLEGVHTLQVMYGCELEDDGTTRGYYEFGYNGEDFISFDKNTLTNIASSPQAEIFKNQWGLNRPKSEYCKAYLENTCIERLKKYVSYSKDTLKRKFTPEVSLLQKNSSSPVICHATGFYPKNITMTWKKNNEDHYEDVEVSETLSNADGTFQKSISLSVKSEEWKENPDVYRCVIQHVGMRKEINLPLVRSTIRSNGLHAYDDIIAVAVGCLLVKIFVFILGLIVWSTFRQPHALTHSQMNKCKKRPLLKDDASNFVEAIATLRTSTVQINGTTWANRPNSSFPDVHPCTAWDT